MPSIAIQYKDSPAHDNILPLHNIRVCKSDIFTCRTHNTLHNALTLWELLHNAYLLTAKYAVNKYVAFINMCATWSAKSMMRTQFTSRNQYGASV